MSLNFSFANGGGTNLADSQALMKSQSAWWRSNTQWFNENGYKYLRKGLIDAGYNPLLALNSSPLNGAMPTATATDPTSSMSVDNASTMQANTAREMSKSQINLNQATARKTDEEAITQKNVRDNLDADTRYKQAMEIATNSKLPWEIRQIAIDILKTESQIDLNQANAAESRERTNYYGKDAESRRIQANAAEFNAKNKGYTTSVTLPFGLGQFSHTGSPNEYTNLRNGKWIDSYEIINGHKVKVKKFITN